MTNNMKFHIYADAEAMSKAVAKFFTDEAKKAVKEKGSFIVSLSGGSTPEKAYRLLAQPHYRDQVPWKSIYFFWGDERCVPNDHPESNSHMAKEALLNNVPVPEDQIFIIDGNLEPREAAERYDGILKDFFKGRAPVFDLFLLGLGEDGHTASLFPHTPVLEEQTQWVKEVFIEKLDTYRITLTAPFINKAANIAFLVNGPKKASVLREIIKGDYQPENLPAQLIQPENGQVHWFLDEAAAKEIK